MKTITKKAHPHSRELKRYISASYFKGLFVLLDQQGMDGTPLLSDLGITRNDLDRENFLIPALSLPVALEQASTWSGDSFIGFRAAQHIRPSDFGIMVHLMMCSRSLDEALSLFLRYRYLLTNGTHISYLIESGIVELHITNAHDLHHHSRQAHEYHITCWLNIIRWLTGKAVCPTRVDVPYAPEGDYSEIQAYFGCKFNFNCKDARICFPESLLKTETITANPAILGVLTQSAEQKLTQMPTAAFDGTIEAVTALISRDLAFGYPNLERIAIISGMDPRRLQYILSKSETTYKKLVDRVRRDMAVKYLNCGDLTLIDVALMLGYSEQSAFHHAFNRWHGISPLEYLKLKTKP